MTDSSVQARARALAKDLAEELLGAAIVIAPDGVILGWNSGAETLFGYSSEGAIGRTIFETIVPPEHVEENRLWLEVVRDEGSLVHEAVRQRRDDVRIWVEVAAKVREADGIQFVVLNERDISRIRFQREALWRQTTLRLEASRREVVERTLAEDALCRHVHELAHSTADLERFANVAAGADLLTSSRRGARGHHFAPVDCEAVLVRVLGDLNLAMEQHGAAVTHDPLPTVVGDASQLGQLFHNLLTNALKFRAPRPPRVHIGAERHGAEWIFAVRDNGNGMAPEYAGRIFRVFDRLHTMAKYPGTGIGLAICWMIVERHDGRIWGESQSGNGTTVYFTVPAEPTPRPTPCPTPCVTRNSTGERNGPA